MISDIKVFQAAEIRFGRRGRYLKNENFLGQNSIKYQILTLWEHFKNKMDEIGW